APIRWQGKVIGVINVNDEVADRFGPADVEIVSLFADQAAVAIVNARLYQSAVQAAERQTILHRASHEIGRSLEREQVYTAVHRAAAELMPCEAFVISLLDESRQEIEGVYLVDRGGRTPALRIPAHHGLSGRVIATGEVLRLDDFDPDQGIEAVHFGHPEHVRSILAVPLRTATNVIGVLSAQSYQPGVYTPDDAPILSMLANQAAAAIENARLFEAEARRARQLALVGEIARQAAVTLDAGQLLRETAESLVRAFGYYDVILFTVDSEAGEGVMEARAGSLVRQAPEAARQKIGEPGIIGWVVQHGETLLANDVEREPRYRRLLPGTRAELCVPIKDGERVVAGINIESEQLHAFDAVDVATTEALAAELAVALKNIRLFQAEREQRELAETLREVGNALTATLDFDAVLDRLLKLIARIVPYDSANVMLVDDGRVHTARIFGYEQFGEQVTRDTAVLSFEVAATDNLRWMAETRQPLVIPDTAADPG
ncbi:MAG: GAF domain-containing protein, partial [Chloroflexota bacterium]